MYGPNLLSLLQLTDPALPIGGYAHSAGLETYVQAGVVKDAASVKEFVVNMLQQNIRHTDAAFVSLAYDAAAEQNLRTVLQLDEECTAVKLPFEIQQASRKLGTRLMKIFQPVCSSPLIDDYGTAIRLKEAAGHYPILFGIYACLLKTSKEGALTGFYYNAAVSMITNSVKLVPLGQGEGQALLFSLQPVLYNLVQQSLSPDRDMIGFCCTGFDIRCMQHERLYSRLYMS